MKVIIMAAICVIGIKLALSYDAVLTAFLLGKSGCF